MAEATVNADRDTRDWRRPSIAASGPVTDTWVVMGRRGRLLGTVQGATFKEAVTAAKALPAVQRDLRSACFGVRRLKQSEVDEINAPGSGDTPIEWTKEDDLAASREGWGIFECFGSAAGPWQLQMIDDPDDWREVIGVTVGQAFGDDDEAWMYVWSLESELHRKALAYIRQMSQQEYDRIAAEAAEQGVPSPNVATAAALPDDEDDWPSEPDDWRRGEPAGDR